MGLIDDFIAQYSKEYDSMIKLVAWLLEKLDDDLRSAGIRSIVTDRAKSIRNWSGAGDSRVTTL